MRVFFFAILMGLVGCQKPAETLYSNINIKPSSEYPATIDTKDTVAVSLYYVDKPADKAFESVRKTFPIEKYFVEPNYPKDAPLNFIVEDDESLVSISMYPIKERIYNINYDDWLQLNVGKSFRFEAHYYDKKSQGYPATVDMAHENAFLSGDTNMWGASYGLNILPRQLQDPKKHDIFNVNKVGISVSFANY